MSVPRLTAYTRDYKEACFQAWYAAGRPTSASTIMAAIPEDEYGRKPVLDVIRRWKNNDKWDLRADRLDGMVARAMEDRLVYDKVKMLEEQAKRARQIQESGMEYLNERGFDSSASAVQAIVRGAELERTSVGLSDALLKIANMTNEQLVDETRKMLQMLLDSGEMEDIVDVAEIPVKNHEINADSEE